jgi:lipoate-protein ligase A
VKKLKILHLNALSIYEQLLLEEALLRSTSDNWCIFNKEASPAIVMGISGVAEELIDFDRAAHYSLPIIRRFTGGGTVVIDPDTCFVTMICNSVATDVEPFPERVHQWAENVYREVFPGTNFAFRENDYVFGDRKFGGNAQYMQRGRWLHHSTFLWDYDPELMRCLHLPKKRPEYRQERDHDTFLSKMCVHVPSKTHFFDNVKAALSQQFVIEEVALEEVLELKKAAHRVSTALYQQ